MEFYIENISASGQSVTTSSVTFTPGLNIICGASDTGKSAILKCIKFLFGGDKPFGNKHMGFDTISMKITTLKGSAVLSRKIGKNIINVVSEISGLDSGDYDTRYDDKKGNKRPVIHKFWFKLLGINEEPYIISNKDGERNHLTMTSILRSFYLNENDIDHPNSIILPSSSPASISAFLSGLLYLILGDDFSEVNAQDSDKISAAKKSAIENFAHKRIQVLSNKREQIKQTLSSFENINVEQELKVTLDKLTDTEKSLSEAIIKRNIILQELHDYKCKFIDLELILQRYQELKTQYQSDIHRLTFIVEGEEILTDVPLESKCPFCDGIIQDNKKESYIEVANSELTRIISQLQGLIESEQNITDELHMLNKNNIEKQSEYNALEALISESLTPLANKLRNTIEQYKIYIDLKKEFSLIHTFSQDLQDALLEESEKKLNSNTAFKPKEHFPANFSNDMSNYAHEILLKCNYRGLNTSEFNINKFDLFINGESKTESHGKGYNAFINTINGLALRQYFINHALHKPGIFIVDTPLHGFDEGVDGQDTESMKYGLFNYFINHSSEGQIIVVENKNNLPNIDFEKNNINIIDFTHGNYISKFKNNRYGFLIGIEK